MTKKPLTMPVSTPAASATAIAAPTGQPRFTLSTATSMDVMVSTLAIERS